MEFSRERFHRHSAREPADNRVCLCLQQPSKDTRTTTGNKSRRRVRSRMGRRRWTNSLLLEKNANMRSSDFEMESILPARAPPRPFIFHSSAKIYYVQLYDIITSFPHALFFAGGLSCRRFYVWHDTSMYTISINSR